VARKGEISLVARQDKASWQDKSRPYGKHDVVSRQGKARQGLVARVDKASRQGKVS
jgi:hypothetical protein